MSPTQATMPALRRDLVDHVRLMEGQLTAMRGKLAQSAASVVMTSKAAELVVRDLIKARRKREQTFGLDLFADPAWDILLELYAASLAQRRMSVSGVCAVSAVPPTTALRWIEKLDRKGFLVREQDQFDGRRIWVRLSGRAKSMMEDYINSCPLAGFSL